MVNSKYSDGYEAEHEIVLRDGENRMSIWDGYFDTIMDALLKGNPEKKGLYESIFIVRAGMTILGESKIFL